MDLTELWAIFGPGVAGAVFGAGWWFWVDAVVCSSVKVSFVHYLPGIFASFAALMFNCVRKEDIDYSPYEEGEWRSGNLSLSLIEALAFLRLCRVLCIASGISGSIDTGFTCNNWPFGVDGNCRCLAVCVRVGQSALIHHWDVQALSQGDKDPLHPMLDAINAALASIKMKPKCYIQLLYLT
ncbi:hypothetical protein FH972_015959 [Carpinus fangiana]|uniref:Transmembrane protein 50A n=1 Tax=Carpinus fangiana TaxID=176857 RepID=A0A5N6REP4_9ROSI|nr:hypothetical protein FH972_015959 [Carpinus fangiana]